MTPAPQKEYYLIPRERLEYLVTLGEIDDLQDCHFLYDEILEKLQSLKTEGRISMNIDDVISIIKQRIP
jgi:hypothetical protein